MAFSSELSTAAHGEAVKAGVQHGTLQMYKKSLTREGQTGEARLPVISSQELQAVSLSPVTGLFIYNAVEARLVLGK